MLPETAWERHSNPKSGWTRLLAYPALILGIYTRKWVVLGATLLFLAINPVLFSAPDDDPDDWMYRGVLAERQWSERGKPFVGLGFPQVLSLAQSVAFLANLYAAYKRKPLATAVTTVATMALKLWFVNELIKRYDASESNQSV
ncbi:DUF6653 family protein [Natronomonas amylolytica]|uniref:DUF6653 family protein n=1 Tax=Natronomonas amylolytica TaxID=3108498 RepID=UPI00300B8CF4